MARVAPIRKSRAVTVPAAHRVGSRAQSACGGSPCRPTWLLVHANSCVALDQRHAASRIGERELSADPSGIRQNAVACLAACCNAGAADGPPEHGEHLMERVQTLFRSGQIIIQIEIAGL